MLEVTDEDINITYDTRGTMRERLYAEAALNTALECGVFSDSMPDTVFLPIAETADTEDLKKYRAWEEQLKSVCRRGDDEGRSALFQNVDGAAPISTTGEELPGVVQHQVLGSVQRTEVNRPKRDLLKRDQRRAHDIIERQLLRRLSGIFIK